MNSVLRTSLECGFGGFERTVILANVDPIGTDFTSELWVVVEDERDSGGAAERDEFLGNTANGGEVMALGSELENVGAASKQAGGDLLCPRLRRVAEIENAVKVHEKSGAREEVIREARHKTGARVHPVGPFGSLYFVSIKRSVLMPQRVLILMLQNETTLPCS